MYTLNISYVAELNRWNDVSKKMEISGKIFLAWFFIIAFCDVSQSNNENYCEHLLPSVVKEIQFNGWVKKEVLEANVQK